MDGSSADGRIGIIEQGGFQNGDLWFMVITSCIGIAGAGEQDAEHEFASAIYTATSHLSRSNYAQLCVGV